MKLAYCTAIRDFATLDLAGEAAVARHSHYYPNAVGWVFRADVVRYSYVVDADREEYGTTEGIIEIAAYPVRKWTECGATIDNIWSGAGRKWADLRHNAKQYASRTPREAIEQLRERRRRAVWVLERKRARACDDMKIADRVLAQETSQ